MTECVEVEITRRKLANLVTGQTLRKIHIHDDLLGRLNGRFGKIKAVDRHGKTLWFHFDSGESFGLRLSMSGSLLEDYAFKRIADRKERMRLLFGSKSFYLLDPRRFAKLEQFYPLRQKGWDILSAIDQTAITLDLERILKVSRAGIKNLLMSQSKIAGLGNAYTNEILFRARISPRKKARCLIPLERRSLWNAAKAVLKRSLRAGGISMRNYF